MANLYLDRNDLEIEEQAGSLIIRGIEGIRTSLPLALVDNIVVAADVRFVARTILKVAEAGVGMILVNRRNPSLSVTLERSGGRNAARRLSQLCASANQNWCMRWSQRLVESKLCFSARLLNQALIERPTLRFELQRGIDQISAILAKVRKAQHETSALLGFEGSAASSYFTAYTKLFAPSLGFTNRNRRPPLDPVNACLSLGYTLIQAEAVRICAMVGLDPTVGFFHRHQAGRDSLACDLTETERNAVDATIWTLFRERVIRVEHFRTTQSSCLLGKAGREIFYREFDSVIETARRRLQRRAAYLSRVLEARQFGIDPC